MANNNELSGRERDILKLVATGVGNKEIARTLHISINTVKVHLKNIFSKIGVLSRTEATLYAIEQGIVEAPGNQAEQISPGWSRRQRFVIITIILLTILGLGTATWFILRPRITPASPTPITIPNQTPFPRWQEYAPLPEGRAGMAAAVYENQIYLFAGETADGVTNTTLKYDVQADSWSLIASKPTAVTDIQAVMIGEKIYIPGGWTGGAVISSMEVYDPRTNSWEVGADMSEPRSGYALAGYEGKLYLFGGWDGQKVTDTLQVYDPGTDRWLEYGSMPTARAFMSAATIENKIILVGGWDGEKTLDLAAEYIPARDIPGDQPWSNITYPLMAFCRAGGNTIGSMQYLVGMSSAYCEPLIDNMNNGNINQAFSIQYLTQTDSWSMIDSPPADIGFSPATIVYGNYIYFIGGTGSSGFSTRNLSYQAVFTTSVPVIINP